MRNLLPNVSAVGRGLFRARGPFAAGSGGCDPVHLQASGTAHVVSQGHQAMPSSGSSVGSPSQYELRAGSGLPQKKGRYSMPSWVVLFLILALIAGLLGFT